MFIVLPKQSAKLAMLFYGVSCQVAGMLMFNNFAMSTKPEEQLHKMIEMENDMDKLRAAFISAHVKPEQPDLTLQLGSYSWKVHSLLFVESSRHIRAALSGNFEVRESSGKLNRTDNRQERKKKEIQLFEDDPYILARAIEFAYLGKYSIRTGGMLDGGPDGDKRDPHGQGPSKFVLATMEPFIGTTPGVTNVDQQLQPKTRRGQIVE